MPNLRTVGAASQGDLRWLDSTHGIYNQQTVALSVASFQISANFALGYIPSGTPLCIVEILGKTGQFCAVLHLPGDPGVGNFYGFLFNDVSLKDLTDPFVNVSMVDHGRVSNKFLPRPFTTAIDPAKNKSTIVFTDLPTTAE